MSITKEIFNYAPLTGFFCMQSVSDDIDFNDYDNRKIREAMEDLQKFIY